MPFTFFGHQAAVLPVKRVLPRWCSGTGLVLGSMAPDLGYFLLGTGVSRDWHRPHGVFLYCLPVALVLWALVTRVVAEPTARHLPRLGAFALHRLAYLAAQPRTLPHLLVVAASIVVGAGTHLAWDLFTHAGSWMGDHLPWLEAPALRFRGHAIPGSSVLWTASTLLGGAVSLAVMLDAGRHDLLRRWAEAREPGSTAGITPDAPPATRWFWALPVLATVAGAVIGYATRPADFHWYGKATWVVIFLRATSLGFLGLCVASWRERRAWRNGRPGSRVAPGPASLATAPRSRPRAHAS